MQAHAHEQIHIANDGEHILRKVFFIERHRCVVRQLRGDVSADLPVLFIVERDEHGLGVIRLLEPPNGLQDLRNEAPVLILFTNGPADRQPPAERNARFPQNLRADVFIRLFHADDGIGRDDDFFPRNADLLQQQRRALVAHNDAVRFFKCLRRGTAVARPVDGADALGVNKNFFAEKLRAADDREIIVQTLAARHVLQKASAAGDEHIALFHRTQNRHRRHALHRLDAVLFARGGRVVREHRERTIGNVLAQRGDKRAQNGLIADVIKAVIARDQNVNHSPPRRPCAQGGRQVPRSQRPQGR